MPQTFDVEYVVGVLTERGVLTPQQSQRVLHQQRPIQATLEREIQERFGSRTAGRFVVSPVEIVEHMEFVAPEFAHFFEFFRFLQISPIR